MAKMKEYHIGISTNVVVDVQIDAESFDNAADIFGEWLRGDALQETLESRMAGNVSGVRVTLLEVGDMDVLGGREGPPPMATPAGWH